MTRGRARDLMARWWNQTRLKAIPTFPAQRLGTSAAPATPLPECVVGSLTRLQQPAALASAVLGGGAVAIGASAGRSGDLTLFNRMRKIAALLFTLASALLALNVHQYFTHVQERRNELERTLVRPPPKSESGRFFDPAPKEIPFSAQLTHPRGIATDAAEQIAAGIAEGRPDGWIILDIRETAETEMGSLPGALKIRFRDIPQAKVDFSGKRSLLVCDNGNRSAETCEALAKLGIDCRFIIGGLEKWLAEGRNLIGFGARTIDDLRAIPDYPHHQELLDTDEVRRLVKDQGAIFVDVRYPGEFDAGHLPNALNLPLQPAPSGEIDYLVSALPSRPVIAPCYDRRSCFFADILGLTLTRAHRDFRGRYTLPWEYFVSIPKPPHVEKLLAEAKKSTWNRLVDRLAVVLEAVARHTGLPVALLLTALLSGLIILPFSLKAERDQVARRAIQPIADGYKARFGRDGARTARATRALYRRHGLTPARNLIVLAFLPVLALAVEAAVAAAGRTPSAMLWIPDLAGHDPLNVLPAIFSGLAGLYVTIVFASTQRHLHLIWVIAAPLLFAAAWTLPASANVYISASAALLLLQRFAVAGVPGWGWLAADLLRRRHDRRNARFQHPGLIVVNAHGRLANAGQKTSRLADLKNIGIPVPEGIILTSGFLADFTRAAPKVRRAHLDHIWHHLGADDVAVRSSAEDDDGAVLSYACAFNGILHVTRERLEAAIEQVLASFTADCAENYSELGTGHGGAGADNCNILIQPTISPDYTGLLFTEEPANPGFMSVELVMGTAGEPVAGRVLPRVVRIGRNSGRVEAEAVPPIDLEPLRQIALKVEIYCGRPQVIEWAYARGTFVVSQSRDITSSPHGADLIKRNELRRLLTRVGEERGEGTIFAQSEISQLLPRPTPASLSLHQRNLEQWRQRRSRVAFPRVRVRDRRRWSGALSHHIWQALHRCARRDRTYALPLTLWQSAARPRVECNRSRFQGPLSSGLPRRRSPSRSHRLREAVVNRPHFGIRFAPAVVRGRYLCGSEPRQHRRAGSKRHCARRSDENWPRPD